MKMGDLELRVPKVKMGYVDVADKEEKQAL